jgi:hypothetical protein
VVLDYGVGITVKNQGRIFEGFFPTQDTINYSTNRPFDFNAGGKGAELLGMRIFAERYNFKIAFNSSRCKFILNDKGTCPGNISECDFFRAKEDCMKSGWRRFSVFFPPIMHKDCKSEKE